MKAAAFGILLLAAAARAAAAGLVETSVADFSPGLYNTFGSTVTGAGGGDVRLDAAGDDVQAAFSTLSTLPAAVRNPAAAAWNGYLYAVGGGNGGNGLIATLEQAQTQAAYAAVNASGALGSWTAGTVLPAARVGPAAAAWNGRLYVTGGGTLLLSALTSFNTGYRTDLSTTTGALGSWTAATALPAVRAFHAMAAWNGRLYVSGGDAGSGAVATVYSADIASDGSLSGGWTTSLNPLPDARAHHGMVAWNGRLYVVGGVNAAGTAQTTVYYAAIAADGSVGTWTAAAGALPAARSDHGLAVWNGRLYVTGGSGSQTVYMADIAPDGTPGSWTSSSRTLPAARMGLALVSWAGRIYPLGGQTAAIQAAQSTVYGASVASPTRKSPVGLYHSPLVDLGSVRYIQSLSWTQSAAPAGSSLSVDYSTSANGTAAPLSYAAASNGGAVGIYAQRLTFRLSFQRGTVDTQTPVLDDLTINHQLDFFDPARAPLASAPGAPAVHRTSATISWTDRSLEETHFLLSRGTAPGAVGDQASAAGVSGSSGSVLTATLTGLAPNTTYYVRVRGFSAVEGSSGTYSNEVSFKTDAPILPTLGVQAPASAAAGALFGATVTVRDDDGNVYTGYPGHVSVASGDPLFSPPAAFAVPGGSAFVTGLALKTAGSQTLTLTDDVGSVSTAAAVAVGVAASGRFLRLAVPGGAAAGAATASTVTATDAYGNLDAAFAGNLHFTSTDGQASLPPDGPLSAGSRTANVTLFTAGARTLSVQDLSGVAASTSAAVTVGLSAGRFLSLSIPAAAADGVPLPATTTVRDDYGNLDTAFGNTLRFSSSDGSAGLPPDAVPAGGILFATVTLATPGAQTVTVQDLSAVAVSTSSTVQVVSWHLGMTASPASTAGVPASVSVKVLNGAGTVMGAFAGTVHFASGDARALLPPDGPLSGGQGSFTVSFSAAGNQTLGVSDLSGAALSTAAAVSVADHRTTFSVAAGTDAFVSADLSAALAWPAGAFPSGLGASLREASCPPAASAAAFMVPVGSGCLDAVPDDDLRPSSPLSISLRYSDADAAGLNGGRFSVARYDAGRRLWVPLPSGWDPSANKVTAATDRLSLYRIVFLTPAAGVSSFKAFPNPFSPGPGKVMTFSKLPAGARIRVYAFSGELVRELAADDAGMAWWAGDNAGGRGAASGTYFVYVEGAGGPRTFKVQVQR